MMMRSLVLDQAEFSKFSHEEIDARPSGADDFGQAFLIDSGMSASL
jgi:hypothetical protein